ncbi:hypothetical protein HK101_000433 [Irineochytrium annulatum]|nr:hypothetical protein HK101_000433 [Irineochytrium annulatum]
MLSNKSELQKMNDDVINAIVQCLDPSSDRQALFCCMTAATFLFKPAATVVWSTREVSTTLAGDGSDRTLIVNGKPMTLPASPPSTIGHVGDPATRCAVYLGAVGKLRVEGKKRQWTPGALLPWLRRLNCINFVEIDEGWLLALQLRFADGIRTAPSTLLLPASAATVAVLEAFLCATRRPVRLGLRLGVENRIPLDHGSIIPLRLLKLSMIVNAHDLLNQDILQRAGGNLKELGLTFHDNAYTNLSALAHLAHLNTLRLFHLQIITPESLVSPYSMSNALPLARLPSLSRLVIVACGMDVNGLGRIIAAVNAAAGCIRELRLNFGRIHCYDWVYGRMAVRLRLTGFRKLALTWKMPKEDVDVIDWDAVSRDGLPLLEELELRGWSDLRDYKMGWKTLRQAILDPGVTPALETVKWSFSRWTFLLRGGRAAFDPPTTLIYTVGIVGGKCIVNDGVAEADAVAASASAAVSVSKTALELAFVATAAVAVAASEVVTATEADIVAASELMTATATVLVAAFGVGVNVGGARTMGTTVSAVDGGGARHLRAASVQGRVNGWQVLAHGPDGLLGDVGTDAAALGKTGPGAERERAQVLIEVDAEDDDVAGGVGVDEARQKEEGRDGQRDELGEHGVQSGAAVVGLLDEEGGGKPAETDDTRTLDPFDVAWSRIRPVGAGASFDAGNPSARYGHALHLVGRPPVGHSPESLLSTIESVAPLLDDEEPILDFNREDEEPRKMQMSEKEGRSTVFAQAPGCELVMLWGDHNWRSLQKPEVVNAVEMDESDWQPLPRTDFASCTDGEKVYIFGGLVECSKGKKRQERLSNDELTLLNLRPSDSLSPKPCRNATISYIPGMEDVNPLLLIYGGAQGDDVAASNDLHIFDLKTRSWQSPSIKGPLPRLSGHSAIVYKPRAKAIRSRVVYFGGNQFIGDDNECVLSNDIYFLTLFDSGVFNWNHVCSRNEPPAGRSMHSAVAYGNDIMVVFGGQTGEKVKDGVRSWRLSNELWMMDLIFMNWKQLRWAGDGPTPRFGHAAEMFRNHLYIIGGRCGYGNAGVQMIAEHNTRTSTDTWMAEITPSLRPVEPVVTSASHNGFRISWVDPRKLHIRIELREVSGRRDEDDPENSWQLIIERAFGATAECEIKAGAKRDGGGVVELKPETEYQVRMAVVHGRKQTFAVRVEATLYTLCVKTKKVIRPAMPKLFNVEIVRSAPTSVSPDRPRAFRFSWLHEQSNNGAFVKGYVLQAYAAVSLDVETTWRRSQPPTLPRFVFSAGKVGHLPPDPLILPSRLPDRRRTLTKGEGGEGAVENGTKKKGENEEEGAWFDIWSGDGDSAELLTFALVKRPEVVAAYRKIMRAIGIGDQDDGVAADGGLQMRWPVKDLIVDWKFRIRAVSDVGNGHHSYPSQLIIVRHESPTIEIDYLRGVQRDALSAKAQSAPKEPCVSIDHLIGPPPWARPPREPWTPEPESELESDNETEYPPSSVTRNGEACDAAEDPMVEESLKPEKVTGTAISWPIRFLSPAPSEEQDAVRQHFAQAPRAPPPSAASHVRLFGLDYDSDSDSDELEERQLPDSCCVHDSGYEDFVMSEGFVYPIGEEGLRDKFEMAWQKYPCTWQAEDAVTQMVERPQTHFKKLTAGAVESENPLDALPSHDVIDTGYTDRPGLSSRATSGRPSPVETSLKGKKRMQPVSGTRESQAKPAADPAEETLIGGKRRKTLVSSLEYGDDLAELHKDSDPFKPRGQLNPTDDWIRNGDWTVQSDEAPWYCNLKYGDPVNLTDPQNKTYKGRFVAYRSYQKPKPAIHMTLHFIGYAPKFDQVIDIRDPIANVLVKPYDGVVKVEDAVANHVNPAAFDLRGEFPHGLPTSATKMVRQRVSHGLVIDMGKEKARVSKLLKWEDFQEGGKYYPMPEPGVASDDD